MQTKRNTILSIITLSLLMLGALFINMTTTRPLYEVDYVDGSGVPLSEIVEATIQDLERLSVPVNGVIKKPRLVVEIQAGEIAYLDKSLNVDELIINGQLHCDGTLGAPQIELKAEVIYVNGIFQCGQKFKPYQKKLTISLKGNSTVPKLNDAYRAILVNHNGRMILTGSRRNAGWYYLADSANVGDNFITFPLASPDLSLNRTSNSVVAPSFPSVPWQVGDEIVIGATSYNPQEVESFKITAIQGNRVYLNGTIQYFHLGKTETYSTTYNGTIQHNPRAEIANLTRNILIRPDESVTPIPTTENGVNAEIGGHVMVMRGGAAFVDSVEFYHMGQAGIMARYPFHWHWVGDAPGQFIQNSSVHHSFQRCVTVHRTNKSLVHNNVCFDFKGHGYFLEDGVEVDNTLSSNLGLRSRHPYPSKVLLASDHPTVNNEASGRFPNVATFWISHPQNTIINNVASSYVGSGFWMSFENEIKNSQGQVITTPIWSNTTRFDNNIAHSGQVGFTWDGAAIGELTNNPNNPRDRKIDINAYNPPIVPIFRNLVAFKNKLTGYYFRGTTAVFQGGISADNTRHYWLAFNQIVRNSVIIGQSKNFSAQDQAQALQSNREDRQRQIGIVKYDGPFELDGVDFLNYPNQRTYSNGIETTATPIANIFSFERLHNSSKRVAFNPEPVQRLYLNMVPQPLNKPNDGRTELSKASGMRDLDGTLTGAPGMVVASKSLGILPGSNCVSLGTKWEGYSRCPTTYSESFLHIFGGAGNPFGLTAPYVVRRSDGALSFIMNEWNQAFGYPYLAGHIIAVADSTQYDYEIMFKGTSKPEFMMITESSQPKIPLIKIVGQGQSCRLLKVTNDTVNEQVLPQVASLSALRAATSTAFFSQGNDLYFRLFPTGRHWTIKDTNGVLGSATRLTSEAVKVSCANLAQPYVLGYLDSVTKNKLDGSVKIRGWACNHTVPSPIQVNLSVVGTRIPASTVSTNTLLTSVTSNLTSESGVNFACGIRSNAGFRFEVTIPAAQAAAHQGKKILAMGLSNSSGPSAPLVNSNFFTMP